MFSLLRSLCGNKPVLVQSTRWKQHNHGVGQINLSHRFNISKQSIMGQHAVSVKTNKNEKAK